MKENDLKDMIEGVKKIEEASHGNLQHWRYVLECADSIWLKCPFQVDQRVQLTKTPVINEKEAWGWLGSKHFLIKGAVAIVKERDFYKGVFSFGLHFDDQTWIDSFTKEIHSPKEKALYYFGERWLSPISYDQLTCEAL
jgi:hypothetical protein